MTAQAFGDEHTRKKLEIVEKYLCAYTTALKKQQFELLYIDACAGTGSSVPKSAFTTEEENGQQSLEGFPSLVADTDNIIVGSAIRALAVNPPFHRYLFNDLKLGDVDKLVDVELDG